jgi:predicted aspartyl protease
MRARFGVFCGLTGLALSAAVPAMAAECTASLNLLATLPIRPLGRPGNVVTVPAMIGERPVSLLLDTGDSFSIINKNIVDELKLPTRKSRVQLVNVAGQRTTQEVRLPSITLGAIKQEGVYFIVGDGANPVGGRRAPFDGILGADFLLNVDVDLDYGSSKLNLISPNHCEGKVLYWQAPAVAIVPMRVDTQGKITFPLTLDGHTIRAILDTGATTTALNLDVAKRVFNIDTNDPDLQKAGELKGGYTAQIYTRKFKTLSIEGVTVTDPVISLLPNMVSLTSEQRSTGSLVRDTDKQAPDMLLGMSVLNKLHVYIAAHEGKLYITEASSSPPAAPEAAPPLSATQ